MQKIVAGLTRENEGRKVPVILFTIGGGQWLEPMVATVAYSFGFDWTLDLMVVRLSFSGCVALQGNLDPATLYGSFTNIEKATKAMLDDAYANGEKTGYIANLGHGITQWVDPAHPKVFIDTVHEYSQKYLG